MNQAPKVVSIERRPLRRERPRKQISLDTAIIIFGCAMLFLGLVWGFAIAQAMMQ
ncbi:MAG TPA: hypothetical protein VJW20_20365 [Candidatus Angelobacter sp.]|nr:hypothetical protein [Candidatus Angelobacter sp.]